MDSPCMKSCSSSLVMEKKRNIMWLYFTIIVQAKHLITKTDNSCLLQALCVAPEKELIIDCKFVASRVFSLIVFKSLV